MTEKLLLTESEAAEMLNMSVRSFRREKVPPFQFHRNNARMKRWHVEDIRAWFQKQTKPKRERRYVHKSTAKMPPFAEALKLLSCESSPRSAAEVKQRRINWVKDIPAEFANNSMEGLVYFVDCLELTKIGFTSKPIHERMETWLCGNPFDLNIFALMPGTCADEGRFHTRYKTVRHKREWFKLSDKQRKEIMQEVSEKGGVVPLRAVREVA